VVAVLAVKCTPVMARCLLLAVKYTVLIISTGPELMKLIFAVFYVS